MGHDGEVELPESGSGVLDRESAIHDGVLGEEFQASQEDERTRALNAIAVGLMKTWKSTPCIDSDDIARLRAGPDGEARTIGHAAVCLACRRRLIGLIATKSER